jgi:hypothetical protein
MLDPALYFGMDINLLKKQIEYEMIHDKSIVLSYKDKKDYINVLTLSDFIIDRVLLRAPELSDCLFFFSMNAEFIPLFDGYSIRVYRQMDSKWVFFKTVTVSSYDVGYFFQFNMYNENFDFDGYDKVKLSKIKFNYVLPPQRERIDDGQLKILVDAMLAVDELVSIKKNEKDDVPVTVLVAGSSSNTLTTGGESYQIIPYMIPVLSMELVDPNEFDMTYSVEGLVSSCITHIPRCHYYQDRYYDLILDDVFLDCAPKIMHRIRDVLNVREKNCRVFSSKLFPGSGVPYGSRYYQVVKTKGREQRWVSRPRVPCYRPNERLGSCSMCTELKYYLKNDYDDRVFDFFLRMHKRNCVTGEIRSVVSTVISSEIDFQVIESDVFNLRQDLLKFSWDRGLDDVNYNADKLFLDAQLNSNVLSHNCVVSSDFHFVPVVFFPIIKYLVIVERVEGGFRLHFRGDPENYRSFVDFRMSVFDIKATLDKFSKKVKDGYNPLKIVRQRNGFLYSKKNDPVKKKEKLVWRKADVSPET